MKNILYVANLKKDQEQKLSEDIVTYLSDEGCRVFVDIPSLCLPGKSQMVTDADLDMVDLMVVLGGDGTILTHAHRYVQYSFPIMGINLGRVGALAVTEIDNYQQNFRRYLAGDYVICNNLTLDGTIFYADGGSESFTFFNDVFSHRGMSTKLLKTGITVNNSEFSEVYSDGVIVSTPIGSSAYNLSAGGPLLATSSNCYVITPICPQSRTVTPLVVSQNDETALTIGENINTERSDNVVVVDGIYKYPVNANDVILIKKSPRSLKLVQFSKQKFLYESVYKTIISINKKGEK